MGGVEGGSVGVWVCGEGGAAKGGVGYGRCGG